MSTTVDIRKATPNKRSTMFTDAWLQPRLVVVTLAALLISIVSTQVGAPDAVILMLNLTAYAAGGYYGLRSSLESLGFLHVAPDATTSDSGGTPTVTDEKVERQFNIDTLMILAAVGAAIIGEWHEGATLLFLFSLSNVLQDYAIGRSRQAIKSLMKLYPNTAKVRRGGRVEIVQSNAIRKGDVVLIEPGERIPVDGVVVSGRSAVDESPITGESMPVEKVVDAKVFAGTLNQQGRARHRGGWPGHRYSAGADHQAGGRSPGQQSPD
ncbi:MAG: HAD-IC family P-type ATPase [Blastochloris sp.]|nr:HAD-IC family P-type ATPase [Blastochloris sp.]